MADFFKRVDFVNPSRPYFWIFFKIIKVNVKTVKTRKGKSKREVVPIRVVCACVCVHISKDQGL